MTTPDSPLRSACPVCGRTMPHGTYPSEDVEPHRWPALASEPTQDDSPLRSALDEVTHLREALEIIAAKPTEAPDAIGVTARNIARAALASEPTPREDWRVPYTYELDGPVQPVPGEEAAWEALRLDFLTEDAPLTLIARKHRPLITAAIRSAPSGGLDVERLRHAMASHRSPSHDPILGSGECDDTCPDAIAREYAALASPSPDPEP